MTTPSSTGTDATPPTGSGAPHTPPEIVDAEDWSPGRGVPARRKARRRLPRWSELRPLLQFEKVELVPSRRRLHQAITIEDLRRAARYRVPRSVFEFVDGGAEDELTLARNRAAFDRVEFSPNALGGAATVDTSTRLFGHRTALPLVLAPAGFCRLCHHEGERAAARAAALAGIPFALTTMGTTSIEDVAAVGGPQAQRWFQLYVMRDRGLTRDLIDRAADADYSVLAITVDTPVTGQRRKDVRNGFSVPAKLSPAPWPTSPGGRRGGSICSPPIRSRLPPSPPESPRLTPSSSTACSTPVCPSTTSSWCATRGRGHSSSRGSRRSPTHERRSTTAPTE